MFNRMSFRRLPRIVIPGLPNLIVKGGLDRTSEVRVQQDIEAENLESAQIEFKSESTIEMDRSPRFSGCTRGKLDLENTMWSCQHDLFDKMNESAFIDAAKPIHVEVSVVIECRPKLPNARPFTSDPKRLKWPRD